MTTFETILKKGFRLTTAEIIYHLPDHPSLLQTYLWQEYDKAPNFPVLHHFLDFWEKQLEGKLHTVTVESREVIKPAHYTRVENYFTV